jgi:hypothetical protein
MNKGPWDDSYPSPEAIENRRNFPLDELAEYAGRHVVVRWDGTRILACAETRELLERRVDEMGLNPSRLMWSYVPPPGT